MAVNYSRNDLSDFRTRLEDVAKIYTELAAAYKEMTTTGRDLGSSFAVLMEEAQKLVPISESLVGYLESLANAVYTANPVEFAKKELAAELAKVKIGDRVIITYPKDGSKMEVVVKAVGNDHLIIASGENQGYLGYNLSTKRWEIVNNEQKHFPVGVEFV